MSTLLFFFKFGGLESEPTAAKNVERCRLTNNRLQRSASQQPPIPIQPSVRYLTKPQHLTIFLLFDPCAILNTMTLAALLINDQEDQADTVRDMVRWAERSTVNSGPSDTAELGHGICKPDTDTRRHSPLHFCCL